MRNKIITNKGSIQDIPDIPENIKKLYKTIWEIPQKKLIDLSISRGPFIDQSQSLNLYLKDPDQNKLYSMLFYGWKNGLKTGMYYFRTNTSSDAIQFTIEKEEDICLSCSG